MMDGWRGATVLIVDDEELVAMELSSLFAELGLEVCGTATSAPEALRHVAELNPKLITMDINLGAPGEGVAAVTLIRTTDLTTSVIFITGGLEPDQGDALQTLGRAEYVAKPFRRLDIVEALRRLLEAQQETELDDTT